MEQDQTSLQDVPHAIPAAETDVGDDPRRPEASQAACERCGDPPLGALLFRTGDHSLTVRGLFEQLFGLYMTMSVEPFDSAACARCSRQFCTLYKALSKEASDDNLWKLKPKMHMVQEMCEVQSELLGNPREFWTYRDESFMGVVSSMAHSRSGSATASTIPLRVLDTHRALSL